MTRALGIELTVASRWIRQTLAIYLLTAVFVTLVTKQPGFAMTLLPMMSLVITPMTLMAYDEQATWGNYRPALPVSRRDVVLARYVAVLLVVVGAFVCGVLVALALWGLSAAGVSLGEMLPVTGQDVIDAATVAGISLAAGTVIPALTIPLMFRFGSTRAIQVLPFVLLVLIWGPILVSSFVRFDIGSLVWTYVLWATDPANTLGVTLCAVAVCVVALAASVTASLRLYVRRDL